MRVFGLDISKDAVSCVEIESAFGRFEIRETYEIPMPTELDPSSDPLQSATTLLQSIPGKPGRLITAAPAEIGTLRNIQVATRDKKAIRAALSFELEDDLPFESENLHYDFASLPTSEPGSHIHVGAVKKDSFEQYLQSLLLNGIDPDVITTDAWAYRCLFTRLQGPTLIGEESGISLLIGFERHKTFFYVNSANRPVLYREIPFGLVSIERKLAENLSPNHDELRSWIQDIGVTGINEEVSNEISDLLEQLVPEIKQIELATRSQTRTSISQILVTGEGALLPGFMDWLTAATDRKCTLFRPLSLLSASQVSYSDLSEIRFSKALALAMTSIPLDKIPVLNLRKGAFSKAGEASDSPLELIKKPLPYILITALVFFATKTIEYNYYKGKLQDTDDALKRSVKSYYGGISDSAARTYLADSTKLKKTIETDVAKERELSKLFAPNPNSPLDLLSRLSQEIGHETVVDLVNFDSGSDNTERFSEGLPLKTSLSFLVSNPQAISKLNDILDKKFGLKRGNSDELMREGRKVYRVVFSGTMGARK